MRALLATAVATAGLLPAATAAAAPTATGLRIGDHPGFVRVVADFSGGPLAERDALLVRGARILRTGDATLRLTRPGATTSAAPASGQGVTARVVQGTGRIAIRVSSAPGRFKYVRYRALAAPRRLAIDLIKARPPAGGAAVRDDGCLRLGALSSEPGRVHVRGRALQRLFENSLAVGVRGAGGSAIRTRGVVAARGRWRASLSYSVRRRQRGTLEAFVLSAKDGGLDCLVQVPVVLRPRP